ncbi:MAG: YdiY family protein [Pyrinomonadaceae bacterium]
MKKRLCFLLIVFTSVYGCVRGDQITLKNGDRLTGKILRSDGKSLTLKSDLAGELTVAIDAIETITSDNPVYVTLSDGRTVAGLVTATGDKLEIRTANAPAVALSKSAIQTIRSEDEQRMYESSLDPGWFEQWSGGADFGVALTKGNSDTLNLALGLALTRATSRDKTSAYAAAIYSRDSTSGESRTIANAIRGGLRYDRDINRRWFGYGFTDLEHNGLQDLKLRFVLGGGLGYHAIRNERTQLDLMGGLAWNREFFNGVDNDRSSAEAQVGQTLSHQLNSRMSLKEQLFIFPNLSRAGEYRINFDGALVADITRRIGWQLTLSDRYLSDPPGGLKKNDLLLTTGLRIKVGGPR